MDAGRKEDATQISIATLAFTKSNVPSLYTTVLGLQVSFSPCFKSEPTSQYNERNYSLYFTSMLQGRIQGEGAGGAHPPWDDLRPLSN